MLAELLCIGHSRSEVGRASRAAKHSPSPRAQPRDGNGVSNGGEGHNNGGSTAGGGGGGGGGNGEMGAGNIDIALTAPVAVRAVEAYDIAV